MSRLVRFGTLVVCCLSSAVALAEPVKYCRFQFGDTIAYGVVEGDVVRQLSGDLFGEWETSDTTFPLKDVKLLVPSPQPAHVLAMAGNYRSHLAEDATVTTTITTVTKIVTNSKTNETESESTTTSETRRSGEVPKKFQIPQPFFKSNSSLLAHEGTIVIPKDAGIVHYEAEMVIVIGKTARSVSPEQAKDCILGVTCGNDISARVWQKADVQWWRAKACDTFGPCGPVILSGVDYNDLQMKLRQNGEVKQDENTSQLIHNVEDTVSFISRHITLQPGDLIFTGTPGETSEIKAGDVLEVEIEGLGVLKNDVVVVE